MTDWPTELKICSWFSTKPLSNAEAVQRMNDINSEFCVWAVSRRSCAALNVLFRNGTPDPLPIASLSFDAVNISGYVVQGVPTIHDNVALLTKTLAKMAGDNIRARKAGLKKTLKKKKDKDDTPSRRNAMPQALSPPPAEDNVGVTKVAGVQVLMQGPLLKRRNNTHNKWQERLCVLDSVGNFRFHKNKDVFKKKSVMFSTVRVTHANTFEVTFGRRQDDSFAFQVKQGGDAFRWVQAIQKVIDERSELALTQTANTLVDLLQRQRDLTPLKSPREKKDVDGVPVSKTGLTPTEIVTIVRGSASDDDQSTTSAFLDIARQMPLRADACQEFSLCQTQACSTVLRETMVGPGVVKYTISPTLLDFDDNKCEVGTTMIDVLTITNRGTHPLRILLSLQKPQANAGVKANLDRTKLTVPPNQSSDVEISVTFAFVGVWRALLALQFECGSRHLVPLVAKGTSSAKIEPSELVFGEKMGGGGFATVYAAKFRNQTVAVKVMFSPDDFKKEMSLMSSLQSSLQPHPNIVNYLGHSYRVGERGKEMCLVLEYVARGSLEKYIHGPEATPLSTRYCLRACLDAANALVFLHKNCILHLDMKPANMLVLSLKTLAEHCIKVTDFGMSRESNSRATVVGHYVEGTVLYMAPEMLNKVQSQRADTYSLGMCLWEMLTRRLPYTGVTPESAGLPPDPMGQANSSTTFNLARLKEAGAMPGALPPNTPPDIIAFVTQCLSLNRAQRPSASDSARALAELLRKKRDSVKKTTELRKSTSSESVSATSSTQRPTITRRAATRTALKLDKSQVANALRGDSPDPQNFEAVARAAAEMVNTRARPRPNEPANNTNNNNATARPTRTPPGVDLTAASAMSKTMPRMPSTTPRGTPLGNAHPTTSSSWREGSTGKVVAMATAAAAVEIDDYEYSSSEDEQPVDDVNDDDDDDDDVVDDDFEDDYEDDFEDDDDDDYGEMEVLDGPPGHIKPKFKIRFQRSRTDSTAGDLPTPPILQAMINKSTDTNNDNNDNNKNNSAINNNNNNNSNNVNVNNTNTPTPSQYGNLPTAPSPLSAPAQRDAALPPSVVDQTDSLIAELAGVVQLSTDNAPPLPTPPKGMPPIRRQAPPPPTSLPPTSSNSALDNDLRSLSNSSASHSPLTSPKPVALSPPMTPRTAAVIVNTPSTNINTRALSELQKMNFYCHSATRPSAVAALDGQPVGCFLVRPSSQPQSVALTHVQDNLSVGHAMIRYTLRNDKIMYQMESQPDLYGDITKLLSLFPLLRFDLAPSIVKAAAMK